jgi:hypothetical protein
MGPKGIGPQRLGAGQAMSDCGCGIHKACDCDSPAKPAPLVASEKASPAKNKAGYIKHKTLTVKGKPLEYNPKFDPNKLITDQSEARDRVSSKKEKEKNKKR